MKSGGVRRINAAGKNILTVNGGSSSIKFALFAIDPSPREKLRGKIERIGTPDAVFSTQGDGQDDNATHPVEAHDHATAVALFCYQVKKWIGAFAAALGGLDTLIFSGGIGENAPVVRMRICEGLGFLGIALDPVRNAGSAPVISTAAAGVHVHVIRTDEELVIARAVFHTLDLSEKTSASSPTT